MEVGWKQMETIPSQAMKENLLILIAEDNEDDGYLVQHALKKAGLPNPTHICTDGGDTLNYLKGAGVYADRERYPMPRMMILDLKMPGVSGLDVLRWVKEHPKCGVIPTVILTSSQLASDIQAKLRIGSQRVSGEACTAAGPAGIVAVGAFVLERLRIARTVNGLPVIHTSEDS